MYYFRDIINTSPPEEFMYNITLIILIFTLLLTPKAGFTQNNNNNFALLELFTSQGCSSCPPADKLLSQLALKAKKEKLAIFPLSFHVDYWNHLGWRDPYSNQSASSRQRKYAKVIPQGRVYTPQLVINGKKQLIGSQTASIKRHLNQELAKSREQIFKEFNFANQMLNFKLNENFWKKNQKQNFRLVIAKFTRLAQNNVAKGENSGSTLSHTNVVKDLKTYPLEDSVEIPLLSANSPMEGGIAFLQHQTNLEIIFANVLY